MNEKAARGDPNREMRVNTSGLWRWVRAQRNLPRGESYAVPVSAFCCFFFKKKRPVRMLGRWWDQDIYVLSIFFFPFFFFSFLPRGLIPPRSRSAPLGSPSTAPEAPSRTPTRSSVLGAWRSVSGMDSWWEEDLV